ncbi:MAG: cytochrome P450, partial [Sandaracinaceae bacterium]|nr:cytochrome P450 [Sandaracinaceae bacterium]
VGHGAHILARGLLRVVIDLCGRSGRVVPMQMGTKRAHIVSHPDHLRHVFTNERNFIKGTALRHLRLLLGDGLVTSDGEVWERARKIAQPAFRRQKMAGLAALATGPIRDLLARFDGDADGAASDLHRDLKRTVFRISGLTLFGVDLGVGADEATRAFATALDVIAGRIENVFALPISVPTPENLRFRRALRTLDRHVQGIVAERHDTSGDDVLSMFLDARREGGDHFSDRQLRDEVITLYLAGHDATSHALSWTFHFLSEHPEVQERIRAELAQLDGVEAPGPDELQKLAYMRMVANEALRLRPPGAIIARQVVQDDELGGVKLAAGSWVVLCPYVTHHLPEVWQEPECFLPERFSAENSKGRHPFAFYPFGSGPRICIGNHLAMMEIQLVLLHLLRRYRFAHPAGTVIEPTWRATLQPRGGMPMRRWRI